MRPGHGGSHGLQHPGPQTRAGVMITSPRGRPAADEFLALCHAAKASATGTAARRAAGRSALCWRHFRTSQKRNTTAPNRRQGWAGGAGSERGRERGHGNDHRCGPEQGHQRPSGGPAAGAVALVRDQEAGTGAAAVARVLADTPELGREQVTEPDSPTGFQPGSGMVRRSTVAPSPT